VFPRNIRLGVGQAGDVPTRTGEDCDQPRRYRIDGGHENYRNYPRRLLGQQEWGRSGGEDNIDLELDQLGCNVRKLIRTRRQSELQSDVLSLDMTEFA
jgi:hypothetical protein